jgi:hypothetical protein
MNEGINWISPNNVYWKHDVERSEYVKIILHRNAEFEAKDVVLKVPLLRIMQIFLARYCLFCFMVFFCCVRIITYFKFLMVIECASFRTEQVCLFTPSDHSFWDPFF